MDFFENLILRTPSFAYSDYLKNPFKLRKDRKFIEAVYLASPDLHDRYFKEEREEKKLEISIEKYLARMSMRCTPFGLFAGCSVVSWGALEEGKILVDRGNRTTRLDMNYLCELTQDLEKRKGIKEFLRFYPNTSIYKFGDEYRYVEYEIKSSRRRHNLNSVEVHSYLSKAILSARRGITIEELSEVLCDEEVSKGNARLFVEELIETQLLVSELDPDITGKDYLTKILGVLDKIPSASKATSVLREVKGMLNQTRAEESVSTEIYRGIEGRLKTINVEFDSSKLFQVDQWFRMDDNQKIGKDIQNAIVKSLPFLHQFLPSQPQELPLLKFSEEFRERYESQEIPLCQALDKENGLAYPSRKETAAAGISNNDVQLLNLLIKGLREGKKQIDLSENKQFLGESNNEIQKKLPSTIGLMFQVMESKNQQPVVYLKPIGGSSGINFLGRFAHLNDPINLLINEVVSYENEQLPDDLIYAEILHYPEARVGNVLQHPKFRDYEIPYLAAPAVDEDHTIPIDDIMVSVSMLTGDIYLRSKKLNKYIIPRLSNAHNYSWYSLPIYRFLGDFQCGNGVVKYIGFHWGKAASSSYFLPRVKYENVILSLAKWRFPADDYSHLLDKKKDFGQELLKFVRENELPRFFTLKEMDNELLIDIQNHNSILILQKELGKKKTLEFQEFLFDPDSVTVQNKEGKGLVNEFITILKNDQFDPTIFKPPEKPSNFDYRKKRDYLPGSKWAYVKFYCSYKTAELLLVDVVEPMIRRFIQRKWINQWFFIKYSDPEYHIRLRFHMTNLDFLNKVFIDIEHVFGSLREKKIIHKVVLDTYELELERYGEKVIELCESWFGLCSDRAIKVIRLNNKWEGDQHRLSYIMMLVDRILDGLGYSLEKKRDYLYELSNYQKIHDSNKQFKRQMDDQFRLQRPDIDQMLGQDLDKITLSLAKILKDTGTRERIILNRISKHLENKDILPSLFHMTCNRIIQRHSRDTEITIYNLLYRYYRSEYARQKKLKSTENEKISMV